tara:strand:- start:10039 stop:11061 length:1023 start_codon:yes stop_codon:yes gene_type:complete
MNSNATIAFDNKKHSWKTRYSFLSNCYACLDKMFFSSPKESVLSASTLWAHGIGDINNNFYNQGYTSSIAVTFNAHASKGFGAASPKVSSNKIYKSFSLEGTTNMSGANIFKVNNSSQPSQLKTTDIGLLEEKGGILYGHIGREQKVTASNVKAIGRIEEVVEANTVEGLLEAPDGTPFVYTGEGTLLAFKVNVQGGFLPTSTDAKLIKSSDAGGANQVLLPYYLDGNTSTLNANFLNPNISFESYQSFGSLFSIAGELGIPFYKNGYFLIERLSGDISYVESSENEYLYAITPSSVNGDSPKGQYADAVVTLGSEDFELFALNVEFETTDYSHSGEVKQ